MANSPCRQDKLPSYFGKFLFVLKEMGKTP